MPFKLNYEYYPQILYKENINPYSKSKSVNKLFAELRELIIVCQENLHHAQEFQKRVYNKGVKLKNFAFSNKV